LARSPRATGVEDASNLTHRLGECDGRVCRGAPMDGKLLATPSYWAPLHDVQSALTYEDAIAVGDQWTATEFNLVKGDMVNFKFKNVANGKTPLGFEMTRQAPPNSANVWSVRVYRCNLHPVNRASCRCSYKHSICMLGEGNVQHKLEIHGDHSSHKAKQITTHGIGPEVRRAIRMCRALNITTPRNINDSLVTLGIPVANLPTLVQIRNFEQGGRADALDAASRGTVAGLTKLLHQHNYYTKKEQSDEADKVWSSTASYIVPGKQTNPLCWGIPCC
jgi:hypothetical protein